MSFGFSTRSSPWLPRLSSGLELQLLLYVGPLSRVLLICRYWLSDKLSPAIFICRLMEVLRKLVGTIRLLPPPSPLLRSLPFLPLLGKAALPPLPAVTALTPLPRPLSPLCPPPASSGPRQAAWRTRPPWSPLSLTAPPSSRARPTPWRATSSPSRCRLRTAARPLLPPPPPPRPPPLPPHWTKVWRASGPSTLLASPATRRRTEMPASPPPLRPRSRPRGRALDGRSFPAATALTRERNRFAVSLEA